MSLQVVKSTKTRAKRDLHGKSLPPRPASASTGPLLVRACTATGAACRPQIHALARLPRTRLAPFNLGWTENWKSEKMNNSNNVECLLFTKLRYKENTDPRTGTPLSRTRLAPFNFGVDWKYTKLYCSRFFCILGSRCLDNLFTKLRYNKHNQLLALGLNRYPVVWRSKGQPEL